MKKPSDHADGDASVDEARAREEERAGILGLGERSARKSYYPELRARLSELSRFRLALDGSSDAILLIELGGGTLEDANEAASQMLRSGREELIGARLGDVVPALREPVARAAAASDGHRDAFEIALGSEEQGARVIEVTSSVVRLGRERHAIVVARDVTQQRAAAERAEREREQWLTRERTARAEAERASRLKDEFVAAVSHELRTPLNAILGWSQLLMRDGVTPAQSSKGLAVIARNTQQLAQIVGDLLDVSRIDSGKLHLSLAPVRLDAVVSSVLEDLRDVAADKGVILEPMIGSCGGVVLGDAARLRQALSNLVGNAIKFTARGGSVEASLASRDGRAVIRVRDTGQGIEPAFLPLVFDRFRQADASAARRHGGLGLGLAIVKQVIELHGGVVTVESPGAGRGSTFIIELPQASSDERSIGAAAEPARQDLSGVRVLVVEDDADARELVERILEEHGADVVLVETAHEALDALGARPADVVVSDIGLPGMDGYELMRRIRGGDVPGASAIPALALTAFARPEDRAAALESGFQEHAGKPVDACALASLVAGLAQRSRLGGQPSTGTRP